MMIDADSEVCKFD